MTDLFAALAKPASQTADCQSAGPLAGDALEALLALPDDELARAIGLMSPDDARLVEAELAELERRRKANRLEYYRPYPKQLEFHAAGLTFRERLFMAGNQLGKTWAGGAEIAMHATGRYPAWWAGRRFDRAVVIYVGGPDGITTRDGPQRILCGRPGELGTGMLPADAIIDTTTARGTADLFDTVIVAHATGGRSIIKFKTYASGRSAWQADTVDVLWFDEEPPADVYSEGMTRTNVVMGPVFLTFTPLLGMSQVVARYLTDKDKDRRHVTKMGLLDVPMSEAARNERLAQYAPHERAARNDGTPMLGSGAVFPISEERIRVRRFSIPDYWPQIGGLDFGIDHPFAGVRLAIEPQTRHVYVVNAYRVRDEKPPVHVAALRAWDERLQWSWPHDGLQRDKGSGEQLAKQYRALGLRMFSVRATFEDGSNGVEAGLFGMLGAMETGLFSVFEDLADWLDEFRTYHRKDGKLVKEADDLISATRYAWMMRRLARPLGELAGRARPETADGAYDPMLW